jgi:hypothetical protein
MAPSGHSASQAPQEMQSEVIFVAMNFFLSKKYCETAHCFLI